MHRRHVVLVIMALAVAAIAVWVAVAGGAGTAPPATALAPPIPGAQAYAYMVGLSDSIGQRVAGTAGDTAAQQYIVNELTSDGYTPQPQPFTAGSGTSKISTENVVAVKTGTSPQRIVIGAHYDSVAVGRGAADNASGVALMLQLAKDLQGQTTPYTLVFVAFGCEERGLNGSNYYVKHMTAQEKTDTVLMINFDSVAGGDQLCVYSGAKPKDWPQLELRDIARAQGADIQTNPGLNKYYPYATTGDWSDHVAFRKAGIPYLYFEATNWLIGEKDGYLNMVKYGEIWHTNRDTIAWWETVVPGRMVQQLGESVDALETFLTTPLQMPTSPVAAPVAATAGVGTR